MLLSTSLLRRFFERVFPNLNRRHGGTRRRRAVARRPQYAMIQIVERLEARTLLSATAFATAENYAPGATAVINATGFAVNGIVTFEVDHIDGEGGVIGTGGEGHDLWQVVDGSDNDLDGVADGNIKTTWYVNPDDSAGATFRLTTTGLNPLNVQETVTDTFTGSASVITSITANSGPAAGGQSVSISGQGFGNGFDYTVTFGTGPSAVTVNEVIVDSPTLYLTTPPHAWGVVDVKVTATPTPTNEGGVGFSTTLVDGYTFQEANTPTTGTSVHPFALVTELGLSNTGTYFDPDGTVLLSASLGIVTKNLVTTNESGEPVTTESDVAWTWTINSESEDFPTESTLVTISGDDGEGSNAPVAIASFWLTVANSINDEPVAVADSYSVNAGGTLTVAAVAGVLSNDSDLNDSSPDTLLVNAVNGVEANVGVATATTHGSVTVNANGSFNYTPTVGFNGTDSFTYQVSDDGGIEGGGDNIGNTVTVTLTVNAAPTITSSVVGLDSCNTTVTGSITFTDPGFGQHTVTIDWGDCSTPTNVEVGEGEFSFSLAGLHTYTDFGTYTITATVTNSNGVSSAPVTLGTVTVATKASVTYDPVWGIILDIYGTDLKDKIKVSQTGDDDDDDHDDGHHGNGHHCHDHDPQIKVHTDSGPNMFFSTGPYTIVSQTGPNNTFETHTGNIAKIRIHLCDGDDKLMISGGVDVGTVIFGEGGDDKINAGNVAAIVLGGDGDDKIDGGSARDLLIGGNGADKIVGNANNDILIAGYTSYEKDIDGNDRINEQALKAIMGVWNTTDSYATRVAAVQNTNATYNLLVDPATTGTGNRAQTVFSDNDEDKLTGSADNDLYFANLVADAGDLATVLDKITDLKSGESSLDIDWS